MNAVEMHACIRSMQILAWVLWKQRGSCVNTHVAVLLPNNLRWKVKPRNFLPKRKTFLGRYSRSIAYSPNQKSMDATAVLRFTILQQWDCLPADLASPAIRGSGTPTIRRLPTVLCARVCILLFWVTRNSLSMSFNILHTQHTDLLLCRCRYIS